jgi:two-component system response regulator AtoC
MVPFRRKSDEVTPSRSEGLNLRSAKSGGEAFGTHATQMDFLGMPAIIASRSMYRLIATVEKVARTDSTVLIGGESGVGKELIARAVHHYSDRKEKPFIDVNCAAFPENLIESELFGYEKGAFSGADTVKQGLFEAASGGTLFLDEVGELDARMQAKLLRVLDGQPYYRLGGTRKIQAAARVVAATNSDLQESVLRGWFRADLYHRLDSIQLRVPSLRERVDDIAPLCDLFLRPTGCSLREDTVALLRNYSWPGNVRELRNVLNKAVVFADVPELTPADLPDDIRRNATAEPGYSLERLEEQTIFRALEQTGGHQQKAADILGISRRTLLRKLKHYGPLKVHGHADNAHGTRTGARGGHETGNPDAGRANRTDRMVFPESQSPAGHSRGPRRAGPEFIL